MCFYISLVAWLTLSFIPTCSQSLHCSLLFPGRVTASQINKDTLAFWDLANLLIILFTSHRMVWTGSFHLFLLCILVIFVLPFSQTAPTSRARPDQQVAHFPSKNQIARRHHTSLPFFSKKENMGCGFDFSFLLQTSCPESNLSTSFMDLNTFQIIKAQIQQSKFNFNSHKFYIKLYIGYYIAFMSFAVFRRTSAMSTLFFNYKFVWFCRVKEIKRSNDKLHHSWYSV